MSKKFLRVIACITSLFILSSWYVPETEDEDYTQITNMVAYKDVETPRNLEVRLVPSLPPPITLPLQVPLIPIKNPEPMVKKKESSVPEWILKGILMRETKSYYKDNGEIYYKDKRRGSSGERGPFQMTPIAFEQIAKRGEQFWKIEKDLNFAQEMAERYLKYLYIHCAHKNWRTAIMMYNTGPTNYYRLRTIAKAYYDDVKSKCEQKKSSPL